MVLISGRNSRKGAENAQISMTERIIGFLSSYLDYDNEDIELVRYGLHSIIRTFGGIFVALIAAGIMNILPCALLYLGIFISIRIYAGGYHASTARGCSVSTSIMIGLAYMYIKYCRTVIQVDVIIYIVSAIIILIVGPVENKKKPISEREKSVYKKRIHLLITIITVVFCGAVIYDNARIFRSIDAAMTQVVILQICGIINNRYGSISTGE